ncbi:integrase [Neobacillus notoginsengisoli]|uniref:Integrase n=1 Tax=Neobacillus notoginsengisoli TaxID=1578198 RepID=A0A417YPP5_9BACI|nr:phage integrase N-terminal SAM-like domain-containing protein [Neobacillus notoginsengisoli]RHW35974.1 integrase [Neobacillus notoginsengisoli]
MPYGFIRHLEDKGYSEETILSYEKVTNNFINFIASVYPENKEPFHINPSDIKNYLDLQLKSDKSVGTVNKELAILKTFFNFLWETNKIPVDPIVKIKRFKVQTFPEVDVSFEEINTILQKVLLNPEYTTLRKSIFILATKGLKTSDYRFKKDYVQDSIQDDRVKIKLRNRVIQLEGKEASYFREYFYEAMFNDSDYVFTTRQRKQKINGPIQVMSILNHLRAISVDYLPEDTQQLTLLSIRRSIAFKLYKEKHSIQSIAKALGIEESTASNYLKNLVVGTQMAKST